MSCAPGLVGEQHGDVLARALGHELVVVDTPLEEVLAARGAPVGVHVVHELGAAAQAPSRTPSRSRR